MHKMNLDLRKKIKKLRKEGLSFVKIGRQLGYSDERMRQICIEDLSEYQKRLENEQKLNKIILPKVGVFSISSNLQGKDFLREKVRIRDNRTCQICRKKWEEGKRRFDVHHLDPEQEGKNAFKYKNNLDFDKMITLCHKCHLSLPHIKMGKKSYQQIR